MKYKARYSAESEIPAEVKAFYQVQGAEWVFKGSDFEGLDALLNAPLAANRDAIKEEKRLQKVALDAAIKERDDANELLAKASKPGTIHMDAAEQKLLEDYKALGPLKDVKEKIDNEKLVSEKLALVSTESQIRQLAKDAGLNEDALVDFKLNSERGKNVTLALETQKVKDAKGVEVEKQVPVVVIIDNVNGKDKETKVNFSEFAKTQRYPEYLVTAIFNGSASQEETKSTKRKSFVAPPSFGERTSTDDGDKLDVKKTVNRFNEERSTRRMPWSTPAEKTDT